MDLTTRYLGLELEHPLILGASPLVDDLDAVRRAEDAGAAAIVMHSLFEEQLVRESRVQALNPSHEVSLAEALYLQPHRSQFGLGADQYLEQIRRIKAAVKIPVIASLNGTTDGGWLAYARAIDQAGADALELNVYRIVADPSESAESVERSTIDMVRELRAHTTLPLAVKLSPFHTALANFTRRLVDVGAHGVVLFNRFYQPDIDLQSLEVSHRLELSSPSELLLRLRWLAILSAEFELSFGVTGGVHSGGDALKAILAGAHGVQVVSEVLKHGLGRFSELRRELVRWLERLEYASLAQARGRMNLRHCADPSVYERANYVRILNSWRPEAAGSR